MNRHILTLAVLVTTLAFLAVAGTLWLWAPEALAAEGIEAVATETDPEVMKWGFLAAALVTGVAALGAAYAVSVVGTAAVGALAEKPELFGRAIILVGLAEGIAIYGVIISVLILNRVT